MQHAAGARDVGGAVANNARAGNGGGYRADGTADARGGHSDETAGDAGSRNNDNTGDTAGGRGGGGLRDPVDDSGGTDSAGAGCQGAAGRCSGSSPTAEAAAGATSNLTAEALICLISEAQAMNAITIECVQLTRSQLQPEEQHWRRGQLRGRQVQ